MTPRSFQVYHFVLGTVKSLLRGIEIKHADYVNNFSAGDSLHTLSNPLVLYPLIWGSAMIYL